MRNLLVISAHSHPMIGTHCTKSTVENAIMLSINYFIRCCNAGSNKNREIQNGKTMQAMAHRHDSEKREAEQNALL
jgi:hypothetical protein